jgi:hypothetical protein
LFSEVYIEVFMLHLYNFLWLFYMLEYYSQNCISFIWYWFCCLWFYLCILQTLVYFYDPIELEQDQVIEGLVTLTQSKENARFMNIHLEYTLVEKLFSLCTYF